MAFLGVRTFRLMEIMGSPDEGFDRWMANS